MAKKGSEGSLTATNPGPRLGGFPIGSIESRAAARIMLEAKSEGAFDKTRVVIRGVAGAVNMANSTCERRLSEDGASLLEIVTLDGRWDRGQNELENFINGFPILRPDYDPSDCSRRSRQHGIQGE